MRHRSKRLRISKSRSTLRAKLLKGLGLPRNWVCLVFSPSTASRQPMAFHDLVMRFADSLLRLFYRGRLGFPRTKAQKLLKTKDVAVCDRQIGVGPTAPWQEFSNWCERNPISSRQEMRASKKAAGLGQTTAQAALRDLKALHSAVEAVHDDRVSLDIRGSTQGVGAIVTAPRPPWARALQRSRPRPSGVRADSFSVRWIRWRYSQAKA